VIASMRHPKKEQELTKINNIYVTSLDVQQPETITSAIESGIEKIWEN
jgi:hypothetical protein